ncbi:site-specific integrase [Desulfoprunum benzoelyticum]|uniref:Integrase n=1 Tax=Desulfoprunum benzoelyticum TaxID=1506996 RepID=A0A840V059_9BACT|nr:site-specific integrase [Desulfoprunum benzoelyticum]MBB5348268.1 integrase [Desulfoprunum benzoelyticum]MBM9529539.1 site-specific integrase [Desulfoprunum benzoelyticum]
MTKWKTAGPGIRYREHPTRKHGIKPDRYYVIHYRIDGKRVEEAMGWLSEGWTQEKCEENRNALKRSAKESGPRTLRERRIIHAAEEKAAPTVMDLLSEYWDMELKHTPSGKERKRLLTKDIIPAWGTRKISSITRRDAVLLLDNVRDRAPVAANRLQGVLVRMLNFAAERGILEHSPLVGLKKKPEQARARVLANDEIKMLWDALDLNNESIDMFHVTKLALKMILLTGQRPGEVCGMAWEEISDGTWNIPAGKMKGREAHSVPLTDMALEVIEQARPYTGGHPFVFSSPRGDGSQTRTHTLSKGVSRHWQQIGFKEQFTPHDLRRTVRTRLAEIGIDDVVAERVLGHKLQGIMAVYNRHGYDAEKRQALDKWNRALRRILGIEEAERGKVIEFKRFATR